MKKRILSILLLCCMVLTLLPTAAFAANELPDVKLSVPATFDKTVDLTKQNGELKIKDSKTYLIKGSADPNWYFQYRIKIDGKNNTPHIFLDGVRIQAPKDGPAIELYGGASACLYFIGNDSELIGAENFAALQKNKTDGYLRVLVQTGTKLTCEGGRYGAGIGGSKVGIKKFSQGHGMNLHFGSLATGIYGGEILAISGVYGAGIGGGQGGVGEWIYVYSGKLTVRSVSEGAGIGGGQGGPGRFIYIKGGTVNAGSESGGAGIGSGDQDGQNKSEDAHHIEISGGTVEAWSNYAGAGIGGGRGGSGYDISITGGVVRAQGYYGAGIGGGMKGKSGNILIKDTTLTALALPLYPSSDYDYNYQPASAVGRGSKWVHWMTVMQDQEFAMTLEENIKIEASDGKSVRLSATGWQWRRSQREYERGWGTTTELLIGHVDLQRLSLPYAYNYGRVISELELRCEESTHDHEFGWAIRDDCHIWACKKCGARDPAAEMSKQNGKHSPGDWSNQKQLCTVCGHVLERDTKAPVMETLTDGESYTVEDTLDGKPGAYTFTVSDPAASGETSSGVKSVTITDVPQDGPTYRLPAPDGGNNDAGAEYTVVATDNAGNETTATVRIYRRHHYTVTFDSTGGSEVIEKTMAVTYGEQLGDMPVPIRTGYFFHGWYDAPVEGKCYGNSDGKGTSRYDKTENCTLYAQWIINRYTITFDTAGGSEIAPITQDYGTQITAPANPAREGYTFLGWDKAIPTTMPAENMTITAQWEINQYTITFDTNGGSEIAPITQDYGTAITAPESPTREGYTFIGWDKAIPTTMPAENVTITAQWKVNQYTITFDTAGGSEIAPITQNYDTAITAPANPTKEGYTFIGWDKAIPSTMPAENMTITAKWKVNQYTITFDTAGGSEIASITQDYGTAITAPANPTREGYTFLGWDKAIPTTMPAENMTITAKWEINQYTITFDTAGGSTVAPITQDYGTQISAPANPTREGYTFIGWDKVIPETMSAENVTITAQWEINQYTITFDTNGGSEIASITQDYGTAITAPADPTREGYTFIGWDREIPTTMPAENITLKAKWKDTEKPTGEIIIGTNKWSEFLNELTSGLFFKDTQEVTINAADNSGIVFISYLVTNQDLSEEELGSLVYRAYDEPFRIEPNGEYIVYVMLVDESLNITYLRSDRITLDNIQPVISGIEDGKTYCEAQTVTITEKYIDTVTVNGTAVTLDENGSFVLSPTNGKQKIVVTDKAGNTAEMTVTANDGHTLLADDNDCTTPVYCKFCNAEVIAAKSHRFTGNWQNDETAHWHICQNENCTVTDRKTAHSGEDDGNCLTAVVCECGYVITAAKPAHMFNEWTSNGNGTHNRKCTVVGCNCIETENCSGGKATCTEQAVCTVCHTGYGDTLGHNFTIAQHDETHHWNKCSRCDATDTKAVHTGGTATCREKAVCEVCRSAYGELSATNHVGGTEIRNAKPQSCIENGYTGDTYCKGCGEKLSSGTVIHADGHKGGTATCTDKAECEVCHEKYGEPDANHHTGMEMVDAVPATAVSTGTAAHWRCTACGKLFADADGKQEIRSEDTVTKKLAPSILDGANSEWRKGDENGLTFSSDAAFSDFVEVLVDGKTVASENYERQDSGTIVELKASYLETLAEGEHTLTIRSASGDATTRFTIAASDSTNAWVWIIIGFIALGIGATVAVFVVRKRKTA